MHASCRELQITYMKRKQLPPPEINVNILACVLPDILKVHVCTDIFFQLWPIMNNIDMNILVHTYYFIHKTFVRICVHVYVNCLLTRLFFK